METDDKGILTEAALKQIIEDYINQDFAARAISLNRGHYEDLLPLIAEAQHRADVEAIRGIVNPYICGKDWWKAFEEARKSSLAALKVKGI